MQQIEAGVVVRETSGRVLVYPVVFPPKHRQLIDTKWCHKQRRTFARLRIGK